MSVRTDLEALRSDVDYRLGALKADSATWIDSVVQKRLTVHLKNSLTIEGSLTSVMKDGIVLRAAKLLDDGGKATTMAGEVFIPRENVAFAQLDE